MLTYVYFTTEPLTLVCDCCRYVRKFWLLLAVPILSLVKQISDGESSSVHIKVDTHHAATASIFIPYIRRDLVS